MQAGSLPRSWHICLISFLLMKDFISTQAQEEAFVVLHDQVQFEGRSVERRVTSCINVPRDFEGSAESISFLLGRCVVLYDKCGCVGEAREIISSQGDLTDFNNRAVSLSPCGQYTKFPLTLIENWFDLLDPHDNEPLDMVFRQGEVAVYFDNNVIRGTNWMFNYLTQAWSYVKRNYGSFGTGEQETLVAMFHAKARAGINQPLYGLECNSGYRHGIHLMSPSDDAWSQETPDSILPRNENDVHVVTHEMAHVVESNPYGVLGSPAFPIWKDSKWAEIFNYDVYVNIGLDELADKWRSQLLTNSDDFPRPGTFWFRDWFLPIYENYGGGPVLARFFETLSQNFPKQATETGQAYARSMNFGEFVHFWSGAAGANLQDLATAAFGWTPETEEEFQTARAEFPNVSYPLY